MNTEHGNNENGESQGGNGGVVFGEKQQQAGGLRHLRSDARMAAKLISLGVISLEQSESLLRAGFTLAAGCAKDNNARGYAACMKVVLEAARLEQNERQGPASGNVTNQQINIYGHVREAAGELLKSDGYSEFIRSRAAQLDTDAGAVCQIREPSNGHAVENGTSHGGPRPGTNGHRNGKE